MGNIFDITKCPVPALPALSDNRLIIDCSVPAAPQPVYECPDINFDIPTVLQGIGPGGGVGPAGPAGEDGPGGTGDLIVDASGLLCAWWTWCACDGTTAFVPAPGLDCKEDDVCIDSPGEWVFRKGTAGDTPCWEGQMYGETVIICDCDTLVVIPPGPIISSSVVVDCWCWQPSAFSGENQPSSYGDPNITLIDFNTVTIVPEHLGEGPATYHWDFSAATTEYYDGPIGNENIDPQGDWSLSTWVQRQSSTDNPVVLDWYGNGVNAVTAEAADSWICVPHFAAGDTIRAHVNNGDQLLSWADAGPTYPAMYNIIVTHNADDKTFKMYVNGVLRDTETYTSFNATLGDSLGLKVAGVKGDIPQDGQKISNIVMCGDLWGTTAVTSEYNSGQGITCFNILGDCGVAPSRLCIEGTLPTFWQVSIADLTDVTCSDIGGFSCDDINGTYIIEIDGSLCDQTDHGGKCWGCYDFGTVCGCNELSMYLELHSGGEGPARLVDIFLRFDFGGGGIQCPVDISKAIWNRPFNDAEGTPFDCADFAGPYLMDQLTGWPPFCDWANATITVAPL
jgi:hypothetical protein